MTSFEDCIEENKKKVNGNRLRIVVVPASKTDTVCDFIASIIPHHYTSSERIENVLKNLGKPAVAKLLKNKLPAGKISRSADLGEIFATEYIKDCTDYSVPINRLRWKDSRDMPMRGDDVIGFRISKKDNRILFLKVESKSRSRLNKHTIEKARESLEKDNGLPANHALAFISERLNELGKEHLSDAIDRAQLKGKISHKQVTHMIFIFSEANSETFLKNDLDNYSGKVSQLSVGLRIDQHQDFIARVFEEVLNSDGSRESSADD